MDALTHVPMFGVAPLHTGMPIVPDIRGQERIKANPIHILLGTVFMILAASLWVGLLQDQMLCFFGVPNCD